MARLNTTVHVMDQHGARHIFTPGQEPPAWAAKKITNPDVWEDGPPEQAPSGPTTAAGGGASGQGKAPAPPPRSGTGSGAAAWAQYAADNGVPVREGAGREEIIEVLQEAGVPVDQQPEE